jgi:predicted regulator of Ras-like GTPase activity (Roadblock/LC7/MglB family)
MNYYSKSPNVDELCAFIAAIFNESQNALHFIKEGDIDKFIIEKASETICVIAAGESLLTVITKPEAKPGLIFVYARKIIDDIREILG